MGFLDRLQTIVATATVTSAIWILVGTVYVGRDAGGTGRTANGARPDSDMRASGIDALAVDGPLTIPVAGVSASDLVDSFKDDRDGRRHGAIDIMAPAGTPVIAAASGTVEKLFLSDGGGNAVYVRSGDRQTIHYYAHLQGYAPDLAEGQSVQRGQHLGTVGSTGNADPAAPHLHFAVLRTSPDASWWETTVAIDPYPLLVPR